jgi:hypothetical protein
MATLKERAAQETNAKKVAVEVVERDVNDAAAPVAPLTGDSHAA